MEKTVTEAITYRRSCRVYTKECIDAEVVKKCLQNATLAPNSSNLQLWEFYHITNKSILKEIAAACFNQNAAKTARQMVVVVVRKDQWPKRAKANKAFIESSFDKAKANEKQLKSNKMARNYYKKIIPFTYADFLGILGFFKYWSLQIVGLFRPIYRQVRQSDMRIVAHKSAALAAQNFMVSMAAKNYDTCPMEGSDTLRIKKKLKLPRGAEINMVISCGLRDEKGIYGERFRVPFEQVYTRV